VSGTSMVSLQVEVAVLCRVRLAIESFDCQAAKESINGNALI